MGPPLRLFDHDALPEHDHHVLRDGQQSDVREGFTAHEAQVGLLPLLDGAETLRQAEELDSSPFEMTHDLNAVAAQLPADFQCPATTADLAWLADLETSARHPDEGDTITSDDARRAVEMADAILREVAQHFASRGIDEERIEPE